MDALAKRQRVGVVEELHLALAGLAIVDCLDAGVLLVEPGALHIGLLLRVVPLRVELTDQVRDLVGALLLEWARVATGLSLRLDLEVGDSLARIRGRLLAKVVAVFSAEVAGALSGIVARDHGAEAAVCRLDGTIDEGQLSDVVLVDHAQDGLLLAHVHLRVLNFLLVRRLQLPLFNEKVRLEHL